MLLQNGLPTGCVGEWGPHGGHSADSVLVPCRSVRFRADSVRSRAPTPRRPLEFSPHSSLGSRAMYSIMWGVKKFWHQAGHVLTQANSFGMGLAL